MITLKTLVVDDELGMRLSVKKALTKFRLTLPDMDEEIAFDVDVAETGEEALEKIEGWQPDILLLDYKLPGISGIDVLEQTQSEDNEMVTIMITAYASLETAVTAVKEGAFDFLAKPFNPKELKSTVSKAAQHLLLARQVKKLARERHQVRFQFISVLGHELKAPINAIEGYLHLMKDKTLGNDLAAYQQMVDRCLVRSQGMMKMILDLLDLTRIESGQKKRELGVIDLRDIIDLSLETVAPMAGERSITLNKTIEGNSKVYGDSGEMEIILNNLISNAVKYNRDQGEVNVSVIGEDDHIVLKVQDTGIGMSQEECDKLFQEFTRIKNEKTRNIMGSGLGLTIVKKIAGLYAGTVSVKSQTGEGSTFTVELKTGLDASGQPVKQETPEE